MLVSRNFSFFGIGEKEGRRLILSSSTRLLTKALRAGLVSLYSPLSLLLVFS